MCPGEPCTAYCYNADALDGTGACAGRAACWEPLSAGSSFCWGPSLEGPTSPFSSRSSTPGQVDRARREVRRPPLLPCARTSQPTHPVHGSCTFPPPCTALAPLACLAVTPYSLLPSCAQELNLALLPDQGRGRRAEATQRRRRRPCGPGGRRERRERGRGGADIVCVVGYPGISRDIPEFKILGYPRIFWDSLVFAFFG